METVQARELDPCRFCVTGTVTHYQDKTYLLVQRAVRVYSFGNFGQ